MKPFVNNPRSITERAVKRLRISLLELGDLGGIVYDENSEQVCGGHQRLESMFGESAGEFNVQDADIEIIADYDPPTMQGTIAEGFLRWRGGRYSFRKVRWDEATFRRANFVANQSAGDWDWNQIANTISITDLTAWGIDPSAWLAQLNTDAGAVRNMIEAEKVMADAEPQFDRAAELLEKWQVKTGDLWQIGEHRLLCGDSTKREDVERVMGGEKASLMSTDPPYLVDYTGAGRPGKGGDGGKDWSGKYHEVIGPEREDFLSRCFAAWMPFLHDNAAWFVWHAHATQKLFEDELKKVGINVAQQIVWVKPVATMTYSFYAWKHEPCFFGWKKGYKPYVPEGWFKTQDNSTIWIIDYDGKNRMVGNAHPTQKPIEIFARPMRNHTLPHAICAEPFSGSGSQMVAGQNVGRTVRAIEIEPSFVAVCLQRMQDAFPGLPIERIK